jgi:hypothetical protein
LHKGKLAKGLWPVHLTPKEDELLSSWLARLAIAHDLTPDNFCSLVWPSSHLFDGINFPEDLKKRMRSHFFRDVDLIVNPEILEVLVERTGISMGAVVATTLSEYEDCFHYIGQNLDSPWIMRVDFIPRKKFFGLQFCPECLLTDEEPYYRRRWRLSFVTHCEKHLIPLLDSCLHCGSCVTLIVKKPTHRHTQLTRCPSCQANLAIVPSDHASSNVAAEEFQFQENLMEVFHKGLVNVPGGYITSHLYFKALHELANILSVGKTAAVYRDSVSVCLEVPFITLSTHKIVDCFEKLRVSDRRAVLSLVHLVLLNSPDAISYFLARLGHSQGDDIFTKESNPDNIPLWFWSVMRDYVGEQKYRASLEEYEARLKYKIRVSNKTHAQRSPNKPTYNRFAGTKSLILLGKRAALSYGRSSAAGISMDIDSLALILANQRSIRDAIRFQRRTTKADGWER